MTKYPPLIDPFNRKINYLRVSVTDRCDFRCVYCMSEKMQFLPKKDLLTLEELDKICSVFIEMGVTKLRITGGEPLVRRNILSFFKSISRHLITGDLKELTLTTNGSQLKKFARPLFDLGVKRVNVSLDTLDPDKFKRITRWGKLDQVLDGIREAKKAGLAIKINKVALKKTNQDELNKFIQWCGDEGFDLTFIEVMPMGDFGEEDRLDQFWSLKLISKPSDIFTINYEKIKKLDGWGDLSIANLKKAIEKSKNIELDRFIFSIGIRHIGQENAKILAGYFKSIKKFTNFIEQDERKKDFEYLINLDGIGETQIDSIENFFSNKKNVEITKGFIEKLNIKDFKQINKTGKFSNKNIMFTGGFEKMSRSEAKLLVENNGGRVLGSVSKRLDMLIIGNSKPTKKKIENAKKLDIKIIVEEDWYKILNL